MYLIKKANLNDFNEIFKIMDSSFPDTEMRNAKEQKELFSNSLYEVFIYKFENQIKAFISIWNFDEFIYVEHIAVCDSMRGRGIGSKLIEFIKEYFNKRIILEVELPENKIAIKRIDFYKKLSFKLNSYDYIQPPLQKHLQPIKLLIMSYPEHINSEEFEKYKSILYKKVYKK